MATAYLNRQAECAPLPPRSLRTGDPSSAKFMTITPAIARDLLSRNPDNRVMVKAYLAKYTKDMASGAWEINGESIIIADDGNVNDGQHRLNACIAADTSFQTLIVTGVRRASRLTVDQGVARHFGSYLGMDGIVNSNKAAALVRMIFDYNTTGGRTFGTSKKATNAELKAYHDDHADMIQTLIHYGVNVPRSFLDTVATATLVSFWRWLMSDKRGGYDYLEQVVRGLGLFIHDPAYVVRERLAVLGRVSGSVRTEAFLRGWIYARDGKPLKRIVLQGELPVI